MGESRCTSYIRGLIENVDVAILIDSGSNVSLISEAFKMSIPALRKRVLCTNYMFAHAVNGQVLDTLGTMTITVSLGEIFVEQIVHVVRGSTQKVLLGFDFLTEFHAVLDVGHNLLCLRGMCIPLLHASDLIPKCCNVTMSTDVIIPAYSEIVVPVQVVAPQSTEPHIEPYVGYVEPELRDNMELVIARSVAPVKDGLTVARLLNPTDHELQLHSGSHVGVLYHVDESNIYEPSDCVDSDQRPMTLPDLTDCPLTDDQRQRLCSMLDIHKDVFRPGRGFTRASGAVKHSINTGDHPAVKRRAYRTSPDKRREMDRQVQQLLADGIIEESCSPWSSPVVLVRKKDNTWRFCVDYRGLNAVTVKDSHPLPRVDDTLDALAGATWFSTLDFSDGYWQVEVAEEDRQKTAFTTGHGLYQFRSMPMGLTNAPATFQRFMELVLKGLPWHICMVYLDDILIYSRSFDEHLAALGEVFARIGAAGLRLKAKKCQLARDHVVFLGHVVSAKGLQPDPRNTCKVRDWPVPRSATEVRAFLGLCSYYRRFVKDFALHASPLVHLTGKNVPFHWSTECQGAFEFLRSTLCAEPVMCHPDFTKPFVLYTDASQVALGSVLTQQVDGLERVVAYASHALSAAERRWSTYDRELWSIVWSVRNFRHYLGLRHFTIVTDHKPLLGLRRLPIDNDRTGRRSRWALELDPYDWVIVHKSGVLHTNADALSRCPEAPVTLVSSGTQTLGTADSVSASVCSVETPLEVSNEIPNAGVPASPEATVHDDEVLVQALSHDGSDIRQLQQEDPDIRWVLEWLKDGQRPPKGRVKGVGQGLRILWHEFPRLTLVNGLVCRVIALTDVAETRQIVVPSVLVPEVLCHLHGGPLSAHLGVERTMARARSVCFWPGMYRDIREWCDHCYACQRRKSPVPHLRAPMRTSLAQHPFQRVAADILELPITSKGHRYVLAVEDYFTKFVNLYAIADQRATTVTECLFRYVMEHGVMETLHTDMGRQFESEVVKQLCVMLGVKKTHTTPYNPKSDGMVERLNRTVIDQLAKTLLVCEGEWDSFLPQVAFAYNTSVHSSTGFTPYFLTHGREARVPVDVLLGPGVQSNQMLDSLDDFVFSLRRRLDVAFRQTLDTSVTASDKQKTYYDTKQRHCPYEVGDLVWLNDPTESRRKLAPHWKGPYVVKQRLDRDNMVGVTYVLGSPFGDEAPLLTVHYDRLRRYCLPTAFPLAGPAKSAPLYAPPPEHRVSTPSCDVPATALSSVGENVTPDSDELPSCVGVPVQVSRTGRRTKVPSRYDDYVLS